MSREIVNSKRADFDRSKLGSKISLSQIDTILIKYMTDNLQPRVTESADGKVIPVPIIYGNQERWKSAQYDQVIRDAQGQVLTPLIVIRRNDTGENENIPVNKMNPERPIFYKSQPQKYSATNKYTQFDILTGQKPVVKYYNVVVPTYITLNYDILLWTTYEQQMTELIELFRFFSRAYWGNELYRFLVTVSNISDSTELTRGKTKVVRSTCSLEVKGYIIPDIFTKEPLDSVGYSAAKSNMISNVSSNTLGTVKEVTEVKPSTTPYFQQTLAKLLQYIDSEYQISASEIPTIDSALFYNINLVSTDLELSITLDKYMVFINGVLVDNTTIINLADEGNNLKIEFKGLEFDLVSTDIVTIIGKFKKL